MAERLDVKVAGWAATGPLQSFLQRRDIKQGIHRLFNDVNALVRKLNVNLEVHPEGSQGTMERDNADIRELLQVSIYQVCRV